MQATCKGFGCSPFGHEELWGDMGPGSFLERVLTENAQLPTERVVSWFAGCSAFLGLTGRVPDEGLLRADAPLRLDVKYILAKFDSWNGC